MSKDFCLDLKWIKRLEEARHLLEGNWNGQYSVPSKVQYPHLWLWDSCFHTIMNSRFFPEKAEKEMVYLLGSQWEDGRIPHIVFNPETLDQYRPNHIDYGTAPYCSSGITQPPVIATALLWLYQQGSDKKFLARCYPQLVKYHRWLKDTRDPDDTGLVAIVHPWESGTDNSPIFTACRDRFLAGDPDVNVPPRADKNAVGQDERPLDDDYRFYWGLVEIYKDSGWDAHKMYRESPCLIADTLFNSVWAKANEDLASIADIIGHTEDAALFRQWNVQTLQAMKDRLWSEEEQFFFAYDLRIKEPIRIKTSSCFVSLFSGAANAAMLSSLKARMRSRREFWTPFGIPSTAMDEPDFDAKRYWQGPVWINVNWLIMRGLLRYGEYGLAHHLALGSEALITKSAYREYYHPLTGEGLGAPAFSWSTLATQPLQRPDEVFLNSIQVFRQSEIRQGSEAEAVYGHPAAASVRPDEVRLVSASENILISAMRHLDAVLDKQSAYKERPLTRELLLAIVADVENILESERSAWLDQLRSCDMSALLLSHALDRRGIKNKIVNSPLHYYVVAELDGKNWIVDASGDQFALHPLSRVALLLEKASLSIRRDKDIYRIAARLEEVVLPIERIVRSCDFIHCDEADIEALSGVVSQLRAELIRAGGERQMAFFEQFDKWLAGLCRARFDMEI